jgi:hypothetical protein
MTIGGIELAMGSMPISMFVGRGRKRVCRGYSRQNERMLVLLSQTPGSESGAFSGGSLPQSLAAPLCE